MITPSQFGKRMLIREIISYYLIFYPFISSSSQFVILLDYDNNNNNNINSSSNNNQSHHLTLYQCLVSKKAEQVEYVLTIASNPGFISLSYKINRI